MARTCASERMADMRSCIDNGKCADTGHIFPITAAYALGKQCLEIPHTNGNVEQYKDEFRLWYNELIRGSPATHTLFQNEASSTGPHPLEDFIISKHDGIQRAIRTRPITQPSNPVIPTPNKISHAVNMNWETVPSSKKKNTRKTHMRSNVKTKKRRRRAH